MKKFFLLSILLVLNRNVFGQQKEAAEKLVGEGVELNDKGDFTNAISKYDQALELDKDNLMALAEKAYSLLYMHRDEESIQYCKRAIATHPDDKLLGNVYVTYGNALDDLGKRDQSLEIYNEGIKLFPVYYQLYFNKGVALINQNKAEDALACFEKDVSLNPNHASAHNGIARISWSSNKRFPALLAYGRFLSLEPQGKRATENFMTLEKIMKANVKQTGEKSVTISINPKTLDNQVKKGEPVENDFSSLDLMLSLDAALDYDEKNNKKSEVDQFIRKMKNVCGSLKAFKPGQHGFFWDYYAPYFIEMEDKQFVETFSYIAFASSNQADVLDWLKNHQSQIDAFLQWSKSFTWNSNYK